MVGDCIKSILSSINATVNPVLVPRNRAASWIIYRQISRIPNNTKTDGGNYDMYRFQLDICDRTYSGCDTLATSVKTALDYYSGTVSSTVIDHIFFENETDSWETFEDEGARETYYRRIQDYLIFIKS
jgi:hypothetical protein